MGEAKKLTKARAREMLSEVQGLYDDVVTASSQRAPYLIENMAFYRGLQWGTASPLFQQTATKDLWRVPRSHKNLCALF